MHSVKHIKLDARRATPQLLAELESRGLLRRLTPPAKARQMKEGDSFAERVEIAKEGTGPWQMLVVACNRSRLTFMSAHEDIESWLFFADPASKPLLYVIGTCSIREFQQKTAAGLLSADDFLVVELPPNDPQMSYFTVPAEVLHDELTYAGPGQAPVFWVPEPSRMGYTKIPLDAYEIEILRP